MSERLKFLNPETIHAPVGSYSHSVLAPPGSRILFIAGQIGLRPDGSLGSTLVEQADQAFANLVAVLKANAMGPENIVKLSTYVVAGQSGEEVRAVRRRHLGEQCPASLSIYVPQLYQAEWLIEVEAIAACPGEARGETC